MKSNGSLSPTRDATSNTTEEVSLKPEWLKPPSATTVSRAKVDAFRPRGPRGKDLLAQLDIDRGRTRNGTEEPPPFMRSQSAGSLLTFPKPKPRITFGNNQALDPLEKEQPAVFVPVTEEKKPEPAFNLKQDFPTLQAATVAPPKFLKSKSSNSLLSHMPPKSTPGSSGLAVSSSAIPNQGGSASSATLTVPTPVTPPQTPTAKPVSFSEKVASTLPVPAAKKAPTKDPQLERQEMHKLRSLVPSKPAPPRALVKSRSDRHLLNNVRTKSSAVSVPSPLAVQPSPQLQPPPMPHSPPAAVISAPVAAPAQPPATAPAQPHPHPRVHPGSPNSPSLKKAISAPVLPIHLVKKPLRPDIIAESALLPAAPTLNGVTNPASGTIAAKVSKVKKQKRSTFLDELRKKEETQKRAKNGFASPPTEPEGPDNHPPANSTAPPENQQPAKTMPEQGDSAGGHEDDSAVTKKPADGSWPEAEVLTFMKKLGWENEEQRENEKNDVVEEDEGGLTEEEIRAAQQSINAAELSMAREKRKTVLTEAVKNWQQKLHSSGQMSPAGSGFNSPCLSSERSPASSGPDDDLDSDLSGSDSEDDVEEQSEMGMFSLTGIVMCGASGL